MLGQTTPFEFQYRKELKMNGTRNSIRTFIQRHYLGQSPQRYLAYYVAIILVFALLYSISRRDFYHPYSRYEPAVGEEHERLREMMKLVLQSEFPDNSELGQDIVVMLAPYSVHSLEERDRQIEASVSMIVTRHSEGGEATIHFLDIPIIVSPYGIRSRDYFNEKTNQPSAVFMAVNTEKQIEETNFDPNPQKVVNLVSKTVETKMEHVQFDSNQLIHLVNYISAAEGFPASLSGSFLRMVYFSVVTITTVGYGDIVPLTAWARLLAGLEASLGIVQLGLFVNSLGAFGTNRTGT